MQSTYKKYFVALGVFWTCCVVVFAAAFMLVIKPQNERLSQLRQDFAIKQQQFNKAYNADADVKVLAKNITQLRSEIISYAADQPVASKLAFDIGQFANLYNVTDFSCRSGNSEMLSAIPNVKNLWALNLRLSFGGSYGQFVRLLNSLERHTPVLFIDNFTITQSQDDSKNNQVRMQVEAYVSKCRLDVPAEEACEVPLTAVQVNNSENKKLQVVQ